MRNPFRTQRAIAQNEVSTLTVGERNDLLATITTSAAARRSRRSNADMVAVLDSVYAAIRLRARAVQRPEIRMMRGDVELDTHPALDALRRVNASMTSRQGFAYIETHKLTYGKAYWVKRRNALGVPVEFEIWTPDRVKVLADKAKPWEPVAFELENADGSSERVKPEDMVWFRHLIDPRNVLNGLGPIEAVRTAADTALEAERYNQRFFDNNAEPGKVIAVPEAGQSELQRLERDFERRFRGTDNAHRTMFVAADDMKPVEFGALTHADMEYVEQQAWTVEKVARVFELSPTKLGVLANATDNNSQNYDAEFWDVIKDQVDNTLSELNEFFVKPDFGDEFELVASYDGIPALQEDQLNLAGVDDIYLKNGKVTINEIRDRDGQEAVEWGDVPIMPINVAPLGTVPVVSTPAQLQTNVEEDSEPDVPKPPADIEPGGPPRMRAFASEEAAETAIEKAWRKRLRTMMRAVFDQLEDADSRAFGPEDIDSMDWERFVTLYMTPVVAELAEAFTVAAGTDAQALAASYAENRGAALIRLDGNQSVISATRARVRELTASALRDGDSLRTLKNKLRADPLSFAARRAETIARTETATAMGQGKLTAFRTLEHEGKRWLTAGDERVDGNDPSGPCNQNEAEGPIRLEETFPSGDDTVPSHPNCRCTIIPVREMPRSVQKTITRDDDGRITQIQEREL